jgi:DNA-binding winged helix-turn-helix (wHTH) protein/Tol biopolymer transport system component
MPEVPQSPFVYRFGVFEVDLGAGELRKQGLRIKVQEQPFQVLAMLLEHAGEVIGREELCRKLWPPDTFVDFEQGLGTAVKKLRQALQDDAETPRYIETVPKRGYRFIATVERSSPREPASPAFTPSVTEPSRDTSPTSATMREATHGSAADSAMVASLIVRHKKAAIGGVAVLASLVPLTWFLLHRPPKPVVELTQKQLTFNPNENPVQSAAISPDGKYLAYSDPSGVHVRLLSRGEERLIPRPAGVPASTYWFVDSWFPDGTQVLAHTIEPGGHQSIWTFSVVGQSPQKLRQGALAWEVSPDGTHIAFSSLGVSNNAREIWVMSSQGDNPQKVLRLGENESIRGVHWSPDGKRLAYLKVQRNSDSFLASIETCDLKTASRTVVLSADPLLGDFCWLADGRIIYARRDSLFGSLWQIGIDNHGGRPIGKPDRITQSAGARASLGTLSATADGKRLVILRETDQGQAYMGELAEGGTRMKPPRRLTNDEAINYPSAWTADSKTVLLWSTRNGTSNIYKQGINQERPEPIFTGTRDAIGARLSADGAWILFGSHTASADPAPDDRLMRIPVSGGVAQFVLENRNTVDTRCAPAPASLCVLVETSQDRKQLMITAFDPVKGRGKVLRTVEKDPSKDYGGTALSPDGSTYAVSQSGEAEIRIRLLSLAGGSDSEIIVKGWPNNTNLDWSNDGKGLYCGSISPEGGTLLYVDLKGNARVLWQYKGAVSQIWGLASPDGRYLAILAEFSNSNAWMVEGL